MTMDDWYNVTTEDIRKNGGIRLLNGYNSSPSKALISIFPQHDWKLEKFENKPLQLKVSHNAQRKEFLSSIPTRLQKIPRGFWKDKENHKKFFDWLQNELGYKRMDDWYNVTKEDICKNVGASVLNKYNDSPSKALMSIYPEHNWELEKFKNKPRKLQESQKMF